MPSTILSDNGVSSGSAGLKTTASNDGILALQTTTAAGAATTAVTIDTLQNVGVGVTPSAWGSGQKAIQIGASGTLNGSTNASLFGVGANTFFNGTANTYINTAAASLYLQLSGAHQWYNAPSGTAGNAITFTQAMTLDASGNLGVGTTSPVSPLTAARGNVTGAGQWASSAIAVYNPTNIGSYSQIAFGYTPGTTNAAAYMGFVSTNQGSNGYGDLVFGTRAVNTDTQPTERARIDSSGNLLVGKTSAADAPVGAVVQPTGRLAGALAQSTSGFDTLTVYSTTAAAYRFYVTMDGKINCTSTTIAGISDIRFKENIRDLDTGLDAIMALKPRKFDWKEGVGKNVKDDRGFIAQEFEEVFPDLIGQWKDEPPEGEEPYKTVSPDLIPVLVKAIQELKAIVDAQAVEIAALKG
jgi:hypothetical protein